MLEKLVPANSHLIKPLISRKKSQEKNGSFPKRGVGIGFGEYRLKTKFDYFIWIDTEVIFVNPDYSWHGSLVAGLGFSQHEVETLFAVEIAQGLPGRLGGWNTPCLVGLFLFKSNWRQLELQVSTSYKLFTIGRKLRNWMELGNHHGYEHQLGALKRDGVCDGLGFHGSSLISY